MWSKLIWSKIREYESVWIIYADGIDRRPRINKSAETFPTHLIISIATSRAHTKISVSMSYDLENVSLNLLNFYFPFSKLGGIYYDGVNVRYNHLIFNNN